MERGASFKKCLLSKVFFLQGLCLKSCKLHVADGVGGESDGVAQGCDLVKGVLVVGRNDLAVRQIGAEEGERDRFFELGVVDDGKALLAVASCRHDVDLFIVGLAEALLAHVIHLTEDEEGVICLENAVREGVEDLFEINIKQNY